MELSPAQQERYARHLLLDGFDQEKVLAAAVVVRGNGSAARWAARYLAASGVGRLCFEVPAWREELLSLGPWLRIPAQAPPESIACAADGDDPAAGALAAAEALRRVLG
jgi:hypothetical protein